jgi:nucleoid-associated protein YgaU
MDLRAKYDHAIQTAKKLGFQGAATQDGDKLHFKGTVGSKDEENQIWNAIKTVPDWKNDINAAITINPAQAVGTSGAGAKTYTVKAGDTLSKIAREHLGDGNAYMKIFNENKDQLTDPDKIKPGQVLKLPV